ncbi:MAG: hypothetical protein ACYS47_21180, partial [Planctomycetota bacterium]
YRNTPQRSNDPSIRHGFETDVLPLDLTDDDHAGADVALAGFASGGGIGPASFPTPGGGPNHVRQGDTTAYLVFFWAQASSAGAQVRLHEAAFDLSSTNVGNQFGAPAAIGLESGAGATDVVLTGAVNEIDGLLLFLKTDGTDSKLLVSAFDESTGTAGAFATNATEVSPSPAVSPATASLPGVGGLFGAEAGLTRVVGVFRFTGDAVAAEVSLFAFQYDPTGAVPFSAANDVAELDAGTGGVGNPYSVWASSFGSNAVMNRTGEWILVPWRQDQASTIPVAALWMNVIQTPRIASPPALGLAVSGAVRVDQALGGQAVTDFTVQAETGFGGFQSDRDRIGLAWAQSSGAGLDTLRFNTASVTLGSPPAAAIGSEGSVDFNLGTLSIPTVTVLDGGGLGGTPGAPILYYVRDARSSAPTSVRAYQYRSGAGEIEVGSLAGGIGGTYHPREAQQVRALSTPRNDDVVNHPDWAGLAHHVFVTEFRFLDSAGSIALRHRIFDKNSTAIGGADRFTPVADGVTPPATVDTGVDVGPIWLGTAQAGETVGLFFEQGDHVWYNEFDAASRSWLANPALVDDRRPEPATFPGLLLPFDRDDPDDLHGAAVYWRKSFSSTTSRLFIRARY